MTMLTNVYHHTEARLRAREFKTMLRLQLLTPKLNYPITTQTTFEQISPKNQRNTTKLSRPLRFLAFRLPQIEDTLRHKFLPLFIGIPSLRTKVSIIQSSRYNNYGMILTKVCINSGLSTWFNLSFTSSYISNVACSWNTDKWHKLSNWAFDISSGRTVSSAGDGIHIKTKEVAPPSRGGVPLQKVHGRAGTVRGTF